MCVYMHMYMITYTHIHKTDATVACRAFSCTLSHNLSVQEANNRMMQLTRRQSYEGYIRTYEGHIRTYEGHIRTYEGQSATADLPVRTYEGHIRDI